MSDALRTIEEYFQAFRDGIARCEAAPAFNRADWLDAQNRLARLRDRYVAERADLAPTQLQALSKVFDKDVFIQGMLDGRQIGEHVTKRGGGVIGTVQNARIELDIETSAMSYFSGEQVNVLDVKGEPHEINHLEGLKEAERRIEAAIRKARKKPT
jgi:hypothetical protein